jgi:hypothetical protein
MCCLLVSGFLTEITQQIHSLRASGVIFSHFARATESEMRTFRKSAGTLCTAPGESVFLFMDFILHRSGESSDAVLIGPPRKANLNKCGSVRFHMDGKRVLSGASDLRLLQFIFDIFTLSNLLVSLVFTTDIVQLGMSLTAWKKLWTSLQPARCRRTGWHPIAVFDWSSA